MKMLNTQSLAVTLDAVNSAIFYGQAISKAQREQVAKWIASRQGAKGAYANMFAPTKRDFDQGARLFTGEKIRSHAGVAHILGQEACRALMLLDVPKVSIRKALDIAQAGMAEAIAGHVTTGKSIGTYCCGRCSCAYWRGLAAGGFTSQKKRLAAGMKVLKSCRDGEGKWRRFPFYYTLLALSEINAPGAIAEMRYAAGVCERYLKRRAKDDVMAGRRRDLAERILAMC